MRDKATGQYLTLYASGEARSLQTHYLKSSRFFHTCVIPVRAETWPDILTLLSQFEQLAWQESHSTLLVLVINDLSDSHFTDYSFYVSHLKTLQQSEDKCFYFEQRTPHLTVLWVDRLFHSPFNKKQGVGLARKIGCDILVRLEKDGIVDSAWIRTTDVDAKLPHDYFKNFDSKESSAIHFAFEHDKANFDGSKALTLYEISMRYYYQSLKWSGSPFAFPTIGSCLCLNSEAYTSVRGFPDRTAGEDFHILNKLQKVGQVTYLTDRLLILKGRFSERVPFGTGKSTIDIHHTLMSGEEFRMYSPSCFQVLKFTLSSAALLLALKSDLYKEERNKQLEGLLSFHQNMKDILKEINVFEMIDSSFAERSTPTQRILHFSALFDGLKTLRFIHALTRFCFPKVPWELAVKQSGHLARISQPFSPEAVLLSLVQQDRGGLGLLQ